MSTVNPMKRRVRKATQTWHLVTNHLNLLYMLAAGLLMEPAGFRGKHYLDSLGAIPGWIPLFRGAVPAGALMQAVNEREHLRPCIVSLDLSGVAGSVAVLSREGKIRNVDLSRVRFGKRDVAILVRAPLPLTLLSCVSFRSEDDRQAFAMAARDVSNVDFKQFRVAVAPPLFHNTSDAPWPPKQSGGPLSRGVRRGDSSSPQVDLLDVVDETPQVSPGSVKHLPLSAQALGGLLATLYHLANRSQIGLDVFRLITGPAQIAKVASIHEPILAELQSLLGGSADPGQSSTPVKLYWGAVNAIVSAQEEGHAAQSVDTLLEYLEAQLPQLTDATYKGRLEQLIKDLRGLSGLAGGTISELLARHKGGLSHSLLLFCLRERCVELLEFRHDLLGDAEYLLAGILFGVRDGWLGLPCEIRNEALSAYVQYRMADFSHKKQGDLLTLPVPPIPQPLRAFFPDDAHAWQDGQTQAALKIAKGSKWRDCIETIVSSADGSGLDSPRQHNGAFIFCGETTSTSRIRHEVFLERLAEWPPIDAQLELEIRRVVNPRGEGLMG